MKKLFVPIFALVLAFTLCACGGKTPTPSLAPSTEPSVPASVAPSAPQSAEPSTIPTVEPSTIPTVEPPLGPSLDANKQYAIFDPVLPFYEQEVGDKVIDDNWVDETIAPLALPLAAQTLPTPANREGYTFLFWSERENGEPVTVQSLTVTTVLYAVWQADESFTPVATAQEFAEMQPKGRYILTADITLTEPYAKDFSGTLDGNAHTVTLDLQGEKVAMFPRLARGGRVYNVQAQGSVVATKRAAAIAIDNYYGVIYRCSFNGLVQGAEGAAGIVYTSTGHVSLCKTKGEVIGNGIIGGICGVSNMSKLYYCASTSALKNGDVATVAGGICGELVYEHFNTIYYLSSARFCYFGGTIEINGINQFSSAGGIAGRCVAFVADCYANCSITATEPFGTAGGALGNRDSKVSVDNILYQTVATRTHYAPTCSYTNYKDGDVRPDQIFSDTDLLAPEGFISSYFTYSPAAVAYLDAVIWSVN